MPCLRQVNSCLVPRASCLVPRALCLLPNHFSLQVVVIGFGYADINKITGF